MWMAFIPLRSSACAERKESFLVRHCRDYEHVQTLPATHAEIIKNLHAETIKNLMSERKCPSYLQSHSLEVLVHPIPLNRKVLALYVLLSIRRGPCESCMPLLPYLLQDWCSQTKVHECCNSLLQMKWNWILIHIEIPIHLSNMRHLTTVSTHRTSP